MRASKFIPLSVLAMSLLIGGTALLANKPIEVQRNNTDTLARVDMEQIYFASGAHIDLDQAAQKNEADGANRLRVIFSAPYLDQMELEEFGSLVGKQKPEKKDEERMGQLKQLSDNRATELRKLETKADNTLTNEEKRRMKQLQETKRLLEENIRPVLIADFRSQHQNWITDYRRKQITDLSNEVGKIAKDKGYNHVFSSEALVYSSNDITALVLQKLPKRANKK